MNAEAIRQISWDGRRLDFSRKTYVMGIINCTPDSFFPASRRSSPGAAVAEGLEMAGWGVDIVDVGGESTRPGSETMTETEEIERVCPVIEGIRSSSEVMISIDTTKSRVAEEALKVGADLVNDVSGLKSDPKLAALVSARQVPVVVMHMRGTPRTMQNHPYYEDTLAEIIEELEESVGIALREGVQRNMIILDPGIGFGKRVEDNLRIIKHLDILKNMGYPVLIGLSRKSFLGALLGKPVEDRLPATIAANTMAIIKGADIVRVHDYREAVDMARILDAVRNVDDR
jgi:dihydropteroate synthase